jgi:hypothetical protein
MADEGRYMITRVEECAGYEAPNYIQVPGRVGSPSGLPPRLPKLVLSPCSYTPPRDL